MRVLLSDGVGISGRQTATVLHRAGHHVEALVTEPLSLSRFTRHVARTHRAPRFADDPVAWLDRVCEVLGARDFDVLLPTQEQVAALARFPNRVLDMGAAMAVPPFEALRRVQDKIRAALTLDEARIPQPAYRVVGSADELAAVDLPTYVKSPVGTASAGVFLARTASDLAAVIEGLSAADGFADGVLVQEPIDGVIEMHQAVFDRGTIVAAHAVRRVRDGHRGGASSKESVDPGAAREHLGALGRMLGWHGALAADAVLGPAGPRYIDVNPRLIEPMNACIAGLDLTAAMLAISVGDAFSPPERVRVNVRTHMVVQGVLAQRRRRGVAREIMQALTRRGPYVASSEELTPAHGDALTLLPVGLVSLAMLAWPRVADVVGSGAVGSYALTPGAWKTLLTVRSDASSPEG